MFGKDGVSFEATREKIPKLGVAMNPSQLIKEEKP